MSDSVLLTIDKVAIRLGITTARAYELARENIIPVVRLGRVDGCDENYPLKLRLEVSQVTSRDKSQPQPALKIYADTPRRGVIRVGERDVALLGAGN